MLWFISQIAAKFQVCNNFQSVSFRFDGYLAGTSKVPRRVGAADKTVYIQRLFSYVRRVQIIITAHHWRLAKCHVLYAQASIETLRVLQFSALIGRNVFYSLSNGNRDSGFVTSSRIKILIPSGVWLKHKTNGSLLGHTYEGFFIFLILIVTNLALWSQFLLLLIFRDNSA